MPAACGSSLLSPCRTVPGLSALVSYCAVLFGLFRCVRNLMDVGVERTV